MATPLENAMSRAIDQDLYNIVHVNRAEYAEEAVAAAERELNKRNLSSAKLEYLQVEMEKEQYRETESLSPFMKVFFFVCGMACICIPLAIAIELSYQRADTKRRDAWRWIGYGFGSLLLTGFSYQFMSHIIGFFVSHP